MTPTPQPKALELADQLAARMVSNWVHGTGDTPRRNGFRADALCAEAAAELRRQHAEIADLRVQLERKSDAIQRLWAERDSLRAEVEREREARKAAQIRQADLTAEVVQLEPMRQRAKDIERLTAEVERLRADAERYRWLKDRPHGWSVLHDQNGWATCYGRGELDAKIDAAR